MKKIGTKRKLNSALVLALCISFLFSGNVFAAENVLNEGKKPEVQEVQNQEVSDISTRAAYGPGTWYLGNFSFTESNNGSYKTINGNKMRYIVEFRPDDGGDTIDMDVSCIQYGGKIMRQLHCATFDEAKQSNGYYRFETGWFDVASGVDYRFTYWAYELGTYVGRRVNVSIWIQVQ